MQTRRFALAVLSILLVLAFAGCGTAHLWGTKSLDSPPSVGADISIPLGKK